MSALIEALQKVASIQMQASVPSDFLYGIVVSTSPLQIQVEQKEIISEEFLTLTDMVRDYYVDMTVNHITETRSGGGGYAEFASHDHDYVGRKKFLVHNGLVVGESVVLIRQAGGQDYLVLCRRHEHKQLIGQG